MKRAVTVGAVLAGGRSSRMGAPKALVELGDRPMLARVVSTVGSAGLEPIVVAKPDSPLPHLDCRVLSEPGEPQHPLTGLLTVLRASAGRAVVVIGCDMPLVPAKLLSWLAEFDEEVAICEVGGRLEPLLGRYSPTVADRLGDSLGAGRSLTDAVLALDPVIIDEDALARFADPERIVFNVNTPEDLIEAEELLAGRRQRVSRRARRFAPPFRRVGS